MEKMKIRGKEINYTHFYFDGCHKFYLTNDTKLSADMESNGWTEKDLFPINELPEKFYHSCPLRFIQVAGTFERIIPQGAGHATFRNFDGKTYVEDLKSNKKYLSGEALKIFKSLKASGQLA